MNFYSPLRYPGGKSRLLPFIKNVIQENNLLGISYVEPYAGGAAIALGLLFDDFASEITINDIDRSIYAFWYSAVFRTDDLCDKIQKTKISISNWKRMKNIQTNKQDVDLLELGFSTFFLNRTNISGVMKAGVIGGLNQNGKYKINARFNKEILTERIQKIGKFRSRIQVKNLDALILLKKIEEKSFIYLDPPYVKKANNLYINFYKKKDHEELARFTCDYLSRTNYWITSYDKDELVFDSYRFCNNKLYWNNHYGTSNAKKCEEIIFVDSRLKTHKARKYL